MDVFNEHVFTLTNSIIGVSVLAMPYCFKQCGIILSILILLISSIISRLSCHFLLKSAIITRRKTFEFLSFQIFGSLGKFSIEIGMIGFLIGNCIAFFVVMGDLGPQIISEMTGARMGNALRNSVMVALAILFVLPLGLLKNVNSLNAVSKITIGFYGCLVLKIIVEALPHLFMGDWVSDVILWRPQGILQCLPIFSMALFCQTQIFEIYQEIPNASLDKMNHLIRIAVNICTWVYIFVGTFGYIGSFQKPFTGNILLSFKPSVITDVIKIGFVLSLAFSFPLVIFPCRASLYSLLYKGPNYVSLHEGVNSKHIPEGKFKTLTVLIIAVSLVVGIAIPNIELVLGLVGSTIGVMICVLFPVTCFICVSPRNTNEKYLAQLMLIVGILVMVFGTYTNMYAFEESQLTVVSEKIPDKGPIIKNKDPRKLELDMTKKLNNNAPLDIPTTIKILLEDHKVNEKKTEQDKLKDEGLKEIRHEPPQPEEPLENPDPVKVEKKLDTKNSISNASNKSAIKSENNNNNNNVIVAENKPPIVQLNAPLSQEINDNPSKDERKEPKNEDDKKPQESVISLDKGVDLKKNDEVDIEAIKKEDSELNAQAKDKEKQIREQSDILIETIIKQNEAQLKIVEEQKKLVAALKSRQNSQDAELGRVNEEKLKAVQQIAKIASNAILSISDQNNVKDDTKQNKNPQTTLSIPALNEDKMDSASKAQMNNRPPIPIELANINDKTRIASNNSAANKTATKSSKNETQINNSNDDNVKEARREILSYNPTSAVRVKREADVVEINKNFDQDQLTETVKKVCSEMHKFTSTEKPLIKMLCQLSEPAAQLNEKQTMNAQENREIKDMGDM